MTDQYAQYGNEEPLTFGPIEDADGLLDLSAGSYTATFYLVADRFTANGTGISCTLENLGVDGWYAVVYLSPTVTTPTTPRDMVRWYRVILDHPSIDGYPQTLDEGRLVIGTAPAVASTAVVTPGLAAHIVDTVDAHDASAVSFAPTGTIAATTVQAAVAEVSGDVTTETGRATSAEAGIAGDLANHLADTVDAHDASAVSYIAGGGIAATNVQTAISELDTETVKLTGAQAVDGAKTFTALPLVNDGTGLGVADSVSYDPSGGTADDTLAAWQVKQTGPGRLFHLTNTDGIGASGVRDLIGLGVDYGGNGILISVKGGSSRIGKGINTAVQADAVAGSNALAVGQYSAAAVAASFQTFAAVHKPVLELVANDPAAGQKLLRVQNNVAGVFTTTEYIDSLTGLHVFDVAPQFSAGATVRNTLDGSGFAVDQPLLRAKEQSGQTANYIEVLNVAGSAYLFNVTAAGRMLGTRCALNTAGSTAGATLTANGEGAALPNAMFRAHASAPGDLTDWTDSSSTVYSRVNKAGYFMTAKNAAPADADISTSEVALWWDDTAAAPRLGVKGKDSAGTVRSIFLGPISSTAAYQLLFQGKHRLDAAAAQTTGLHETQTNALSGSGGGLSVFYVDPADYPSGATLRCLLTALCNDVAPASTFTLSLVPITATTGAAANVICTTGASLSGSDAVVTTPAANSRTRSVSTDFAMPASTGFYALQLVVSATMAASSSVAIRGRLDVKY